MITYLLLFPVVGLCVLGAALVLYGLVGARAGQARGKRYQKWFV